MSAKIAGLFRTLNESDMNLILEAYVRAEISLERSLLTAITDALPGIEKCVDGSSTLETVELESLNDEPICLGNKLSGKSMQSYTVNKARLVEMYYLLNGQVFRRSS